MGLHMNRIKIGLVVLAGWFGVSTLLAGNTCIWSGSWDTTPVNTDDVIVVSSGGNLTWSNSFPWTVASWTQAETYAGTVTITTVYQAGGFTNFTIMGDAMISGGAWTHGANSAGETNLLRVTVYGNLLVTNASITANACGYGAGYGPGIVGAGSNRGGAHGGAGTAGSVEYIPNKLIYGAIAAPVNLGSGGSTKGVGGGAILLTVAGTTTVATAGVITANGGSGLPAPGQGGSGGTIFLTTGRLTGNGAFLANGGDASTSANGAGGGGRIALVLTGDGETFSSWSGSAAAFGGSGSGARAAAGTVYQKVQDGSDTLIIDNNDYTVSGQISTLMPDGTDLNSFSNVVVRNNGVLGVQAGTTLDFTAFSPTVYGVAQSFIAVDGDANVTYPADWLVDGYTLLVGAITPYKPINLTIGSGGALMQYRNMTLETYKLNLTISGNLTIMSNGGIHANALGFYKGYGPGVGRDTYCGGSHGGTGGGGTSTTPRYNTNPTYGSVIAPANLGSGSGDTAGGSVTSGGGAILLTVPGTTTVASAGLISASAGMGGAGGSVYLTTGWLNGSGTIRANGETGSSGLDTRGSGGGGRVAIILTGTDASLSNWTGTNSAYGGSTGPATPGAAGTVYLQVAGTPAGAGTVVVDNQNTAVNETFTPLPAFSNSTENLTLTKWAARNNGRIGLVTNAAIWSLTLNSNSYLELAGSTLTTTYLTITNGVRRPSVYTAAELGGQVSDSSGGNGRVIVTGDRRGTCLIVK